jgi:uncharacterized protein (UPF0335 family)
MARTNGYPATIVKGFVKEIETLEDEATKIRLNAMGKIDKIREQQGDVYDAAKEKGIPKRALRRVIKVRALEAKAEKAREDLEQDEQDSFDLLRLALGDLEDTELGKAAMARMAARSKEEEANVDELADTKH